MVSIEVEIGFSLTSLMFEAIIMPAIEKAPAVISIHNSRSNTLAPSTTYLKQENHYSNISKHWSFILT